MFWTNLILLIRLRWEKFNIFLEGLVFDEFTNIKKQRERNEMKVIDALAEEIEEESIEKSLADIDKKYSDCFTDDTARRLLTDTSHLNVTETEKELWSGKSDGVFKTVKSNVKDKKLKPRDWVNEWDHGSYEIRGGHGNKELFSFKTVEYDNRILNEEYFPMQSGRILKVVTREYPLMDNCPYDASYSVLDDHIYIKMDFDMPDLFNPNTGEYDRGEKRKGFTQKFSLESIFLLRGNDMDFIKKKLGYNMPYEVFHSTASGLIGCDLLIETYASPNYNYNSVANFEIPVLKKDYSTPSISMRMNDQGDVRVVGHNVKVNTVKQISNRY